uniref:GDP-mannose 4,6-dehydratase n=1 Tax=viral metagenome TaxID=1070528 RepID=A0A6C0BK70_9ZZZZ
MITPIALIIGLSGQIGYYLTHVLLTEHYHVIGLARHLRTSDFPPEVEQIYMDINQHEQIIELIQQTHPTEIYHLASPTNIQETIDHPISTFQTNLISLTHLCDTIQSMPEPKPKLFSAGSAEMFRGHITPDHLSFAFDEKSQNFAPISPYGISKVAAYWTLKYYREQCHVPCWTGILCNVISPQLKETYLIPKIIKHVKYHVETVLPLGNLDLEKDFSHALDVARGIVQIMHNTQQPLRDYVIASGQSHSLRYLVELIYRERGCQLVWEDNKGYDEVSHQLLVTSDPTLCRSYEKTHEKILGQNHTAIGWHPQYTMETILHEMYTHAHVHMSQVI